MRYYILLGGILFVYMTLWFIISLIKKRNDVADIAWGLGFVLIAWISFFLGEGGGLQSLIVRILVSIWGVRLAWHIAKRNRKTIEDSRYRVWRDQWGAWFYLRSYVQVYLLQGIFLFSIAISVMYIHQQSSSVFSLVAWLGLLLWGIGFYFEAVADAQLASFLKEPANKGRLMRYGLWQYSRHPNYFGEVTQWWGIWLIACSVPGGWVTVLSPITITFLILKVSGIPLLEKKFAQHPEFVEYKKHVSVFFPLPPKSLT